MVALSAGRSHATTGVIAPSAGATIAQAIQWPEFHPFQQQRGFLQMNYEVVLQFEDDGPSTIESLMALEDRLIDALDGFAEVDGHSVGEEGVYITILAKDPVALWDKIERMVEKAAEDDLVLIATAYRKGEDDDFTVLWPADYEGEFSVA
ncbi:MAG: hypothetical protein NW216_03700 [Hyphomicrobium sp.]|nr:hypothetical protein [Hyphomicrobium sp.]